jgi:rRNA maturation RNase YbeY
MADDNLYIQNFTKSNLPTGRLLFANIAKDILGKKYSLDLIFVGDSRAKKLNQKFRNKNYIPNVLSFPLDKTSGQIFINPNKVKTECKKFEMNSKKYLLYLFIHGCLHLKGYDHGDEMEKLEEKFLKKFSTL